MYDESLEEMLVRLERVLSKDKLDEWYHIQGKTAGRIATMYDVSPRAIHEMTRRLNVKKKVRKSRTVEDAKDELKAFFEQHGQFSVKYLETENSGLARYCSNTEGSVRAFCYKNQLEYILIPTKTPEWTAEMSVGLMRELHSQLSEVLDIVDNQGYPAFLDWVNKNGGLICYLHKLGLHHIIDNQSKWTDAKCFKLVKDYSGEAGGPINPMVFREDYPGFHTYIYRVHGSFEHFIETYHLQDDLKVDNFVYDDESMRQKIKEAVEKNGGIPVRSGWLHRNGYEHVMRKITERKGNGSFRKGCEALGISSLIIHDNTQWDHQLAFEKVKELREMKGSPLLSFDFVKHQHVGLRGWIIKTYGELQQFFNEHGMSDDFIYSPHVWKERWAFGIRFQELVKEAMEVYYPAEQIRYNKWIENNVARPDFVIGETGLWFDAKLSSFALKSDGSIQKYAERNECEKLIIIYLLGPLLKPNNIKIKMLPIDRLFPDLIENGKEELVQSIVELKNEVDRADDMPILPAEQRQQKTN